MEFHNFVALAFVVLGPSDGNPGVKVQVFAAQGQQLGNAPARHVTLFCLS
jgi:hypothetical protein